MTEELIIGGYELKNCVATGATTQIWECNEPGSATPLAMKLLLDDVRKDAVQRGVLKHEFKVGKSLEHPMFLQFYNIEINRDHSFFVMDFYKSPSLKNQITSNLVAIQSSFKKLAESLANAFQFMHESGWLHRDIKPDNILVNRAGETRIIDFSLSSRIKGALGLLVSGKQDIKGTRTYIAPETILRKPATPQTDMYSLGVTLFEILTGVPPFAGESPNDLLKKHLGETATEPSAFNSNVTKDLDRVILRMLEKNPKKRFESMQEVAQALQPLRCFEEDPLALRDRELKEAKELASQSVDKRLDSRADHDRTQKGITAPLPSKPKRAVNKALLEEEERRLEKEKAKKQQAAGQQPQPGGLPHPNMPMQPGMPYPNMPMQPGMPYPNMPMQPGMPFPNMPMQPGMPYPGQQMPQGMAYPSQPMPPGAIPQGMPPVQPPAPQTPSPQAPAPEAPSPQTPAPEAQSQAPSQPPQQTQPAPASSPLTRPEPPPPPAVAPEELEEASFDDFNIE